MKKISGVYKITNEITGDFYIGSSRNIKERWHSHRKHSIWRKHPNVKLYQLFAQYGLNNFTFEIIEETDNLKEREQYWMDQLKPSYNINRAKSLDIERQKQKMKEWYNANRTDINNYYRKLCL